MREEIIGDCRLILGDCREVLSKLPAESVHSCVTSPPYFGLRSYGTEPQVWGGDPGCEHSWSAEGKSGQRMRNGLGGSLEGATVADGMGETLHPSTGAFCLHCNAWRGSLGLEPTPTLYIEHMVEVFREARRVLRKDGTLWLNIGDSYAGSFGAQSKREGEGLAAINLDRFGNNNSLTRNPKVWGIKPKDLLGIPWMLAFALRDDGWYLRRDIIWHKPNPMPESVTDRPTSSHEYLFLLTKEPRYYYDGEAIKEPAVNGELFHGDYAASGDRMARNGRQPRPSVAKGGFGGKTAGTDKPAFRAVTATRNKRSVWTIATAPFRGAHFATFPPALVEPCIKAGTSERGVCPKCGAGWERVVEKPKPPKEVFANRRDPGDALVHSGFREEGKLHGNGQKLQNWLNEHPIETIDWRPTCSCKAKGIAKPTVIDPFGGAATTALTASKLGRSGISIELSAAYHDIACERIEKATGPRDSLGKVA